MRTSIILIKGTIRLATLATLFSGLLAVGCTQNKPEDDVLTEAELSQILVEFYEAEARLSFLPVTRDSAMKLFLPFEQSVLQKQKISDDVLKKTYRYYLEHPKELGRVYDSVIDTLSLRQNRAVK